ncbi:MAG: antitoxin [Propionibacteriales bacterium]|nr:antitoxin [Propionibacteriales bacterium]
MRTTLALADELLVAARRRARATGQTLGQVVEAALRRELASSRTDDRPSVPVFRGGTGPHPGLDLTSNAALHEALDEGVAIDARR